VWWQTTRLLRHVTELAYLRNQMTRGTVAGPGDARARELIHLVDQPGPRALTDYQGLRMLPPRRRRSLPPPPPGQAPGQLTPQYPPPQAPGPAGVGGNWPVRR
jgi:hypothetical protein